MPEQSLFEKLCGGPCAQLKSLDDFYLTNRGSPMKFCKDCHNVRTKDWWDSTDPAVKRQYSKNQRRNNLKARKASEKKHRIKKRDMGGFRTPERRAYHKRFRDGRKQMIFNVYSNGACACCGERDLRLLTIDHLNNDGGAERRSLGARGSTQRIYARLIREGFPKGYQVLCFSCNTGKHIAGGEFCPHQLTVKELWQSFLDFVLTKSPPSEADVLRSQVA